MAGGGVTGRVEYRVLQGGDYTRRDAEADGRKPGNTPLALGSATGYLESSGARRFVDCPVRASGEELLEVSVGVGGSGADMKKRDVREGAARLAADAARHVA